MTAGPREVARLPGRYETVVLSPAVRSTVYEALFTQGLDAVLITAADGRILRANTRACALLGHTERELLTLCREDVVDRREQRWREALEALDRQGSFRGVVRMRRRRGETFSAEITMGPFRDGDVPRAYLSFREISVGEVVDSPESCGDMYIGVDADGVVTYINRRAEARLGVAGPDVVGRHIREGLPDLVGTTFEAALGSVARTGEPTTVEQYFGPADLWCQMRARPLRRGGVEIHVRDLAERRASELERARLLAAERAARAEAELAQAALAHQATHDELTGLLNRAGLEQEVQRILATRRPSGLTVLSIDLDRFSLVNDSLGHAAGDQVLIAFARGLAEASRPADLVARFGGDEFVVVMVDAAPEDADRMTESVLSESRRPAEVGHRLLVTTSVGMAAAERADPFALLREADAAVRSAKEAGGDRAVWFAEGLHAASLQRMQTEQDLRTALVRQELFVEYQPAFDLRDRRIRHIEALVRWQHPVRGRVAPQDFIPVAEDCGLIARIGEQVLSRALEQAARWVRVPDLRVWVNASPRQVADERFPDLLAAHLDDAGLPSGRLGIEVTESVLADRSRLTDVLGAVRAMGVAIAIDDFGTGYSSLARLGSFPVDVIKIDRTFVADLGSPRGEALLTGIVTLAHALGTHVIAEGVETPEQLATVARLGVDSASGFLLARPGPAERIHRKPTTGFRSTRLQSPSARSKSAVPMHPCVTEEEAP